DVRRIVGQAEDTQPFLLVVVEILATQRPLAEVLAEMRGVGAGAAVADQEYESALLVARKDGVGEGLDLGGVDLLQLLADAVEKLPRRELDTEHGGLLRMN